MQREPIVAGRFYPGSGPALVSEVRSLLAQAPPRRQNPTILAMAPHAGYVYSGQVAAVTLGQANLAPSILLLCPNHTGMGTPFSVWDKGLWRVPGCSMDIDEPLAAALLAGCGSLRSDRAAHAEEHSLEVIMPFLCETQPGFKGVPLSVAEHNLATLGYVARDIAAVLKTWPEKVSIVVSSDMSHYLPHGEARKLDAQALEPILALDPVGLYSVVREMGISMCGVLPMTLGLMIALELGATHAELAAYGTSGDASGDYERVVGYAGVIVE